MYATFVTNSQVFTYAFFSLSVLNEHIMDSHTFSIHMFHS